MIVVDSQRCTGCGACLEACPHGAVYLVDDVASVDGALCRECELCVAACPNQAIRLITASARPANGSGRVVTPVARPEVIRVGTQPAPVPLRTRVLPVMGSVLAWAGQEILPRMAGYFLYRLDRRMESKRGSAVTRASTGSVSPGADRGGGRQRRRRRRGH